MNHNFQWAKESLMEIINDKQIRFLQVNRKTTSITWIGNATFLIQSGGLNILTDPIEASFMVGKKGSSAHGIGLDVLPSIDVVLITHNQLLRQHFHTFRQLKGDPLYLVPDGMQDLFIEKGFINVKEVSWWNHFVKLPLQFTCVPARQGARKTLFNLRKYSLGGWICHNPKTGEHLYFAGDTGYFPGFVEIGRKFPIDFAIIPIGTYKYQWFGKVSPILNLEDAVQAFLDLQADFLIPMQYGTYAIDESTFEISDRLMVEWSKRGLSEENIRLFQPGETWKIGDPSRREGKYLQ